jgi:hypothetical protein
MPVDAPVPRRFDAAPSAQRLTALDACGRELAFRSGVEDGSTDVLNVGRLRHHRTRHHAVLVEHLHLGGLLEVGLREQTTETVGEGELLRRPHLRDPSTEPHRGVLHALGRHRARSTSTLHGLAGDGGRSRFLLRELELEHPLLQLDLVLQIPRLDVHSPLLALLLVEHVGLELLLLEGHGLVEERRALEAVEEAAGVAVRRLLEVLVELRDRRAVGQLPELERRDALEQTDHLVLRLLAGLDFVGDLQELVQHRPTPPCSGLTALPCP